MGLQYLNKGFPSSDPPIPIRPLGEVLDDLMVSYGGFLS